MKADEKDVLSIQNNERMTSYVTLRITRFSPNNDQPPNSSHFSYFITPNKYYLKITVKYNSYDILVNSYHVNSKFREEEENFCQINFWKSQSFVVRKYFAFPSHRLNNIAMINDSYSQLSPCGHLAITAHLIIQAETKSQAKIDWRRLTKINSHYYGHELAVVSPRVSAIN